MKNKRNQNYHQRKNGKNLMKIANQYKNYPSIRLKWLYEIVRTNTEANNLISAFVCQLHIVALIETVISEIKDISQNEESCNFYLSVVQPIKTYYSFLNNSECEYPLSPKNDLSFMPDVLQETDIDIENIKSDEASILLLSDFTIDLLLDSIDKALSIGKKISLHYSMRPLYSLQIRIFQAMRNYKDMSKSINNLSQTIGCIRSESLGYDTAMSFFYVEYRKDKEEIIRQIYTVSNQRADKFIDILNSSKRFDGHTAKICKNHNITNCEEQGVCVVPVEKVDEYNEEEESYEYPHCWDKFLSYEINEHDSNVIITEYTTKNYLPSYKWASNVIKEKSRKISYKTFISNALNDETKVLKQVFEEYELWFQTKNINDEFFANDLEKFMNTICISIENIVSKKKLYDKCNNEEKGKIMKKLKIFKKSINKCLSVFRTAINELNEPESYKEFFEKSEEKSNEFVKLFNLGKLSECKYICKFEPMDDGIEYLE